MASDLLSTVGSELAARLDELRPLLSEYERLLAAVDALGAGDDGTASPPVAERTVSATQRSRARHGRRSPSTGAIKPAASSSNPRVTGSRKRARAPRGAAQHTILAALEHGSHTTSELVKVTALGAPNIRSNLRRLLRQGTITKAERSGRTAYALASSSAGGKRPMQLRRARGKAPRSQAP
jgi:hypothetical protein